MNYGYYTSVALLNGNSKWMLNFQVESNWGRHRSIIYARQKGWITDYDLANNIISVSKTKDFFPDSCLLLTPVSFRGQHTGNLRRQKISHG